MRLTVDGIMHKMSILKYPRILIDMELSVEFPNSVTFVVEHGLVINQEVDYQ